MTSSGMKRGLAVSAISALAMTGLPFVAGTANAIPLEERYAGSSIQFFTADGTGTPGVVSGRSDGVDNTVTLMTAGGENVGQVRYSVTDAASNTTVLGTATRANGVFALQWSPDSSLFGTVVTLWAQALTPAGAELGSPVNKSVLVDQNATTANVTNGPGTQVGVFNAPYGGAQHSWGVISGTTSKLTGAIQIQDRQDTAEGAADFVDASKVGDASGGVRAFSGVADFDNNGSFYEFDTTDPKADEAVVQVLAGTDDHEAVTLYKQVITTVTATAAPTTVPSSVGDSDVTVTVLDQNGKPVYGAEVVGQDAGATGTKYTDVDGKAVWTEVPGSDAGQTYHFFVNVDDEDGYQDLKDFRKSVTVSTYDDTASSITASQSELGGALDRDEYAGAPLSVTVKDQLGAGMAGQAVNYRWSVDPFDPEAANQASGAGSLVSGAGGKVDVPAPENDGDGVYTLNVWQEKDGNPGQTAGDLAMTPMNVKIGEAELDFDKDGDNGYDQALAGSTYRMDATLALADGTPLPGREVTFEHYPWLEIVAGDGINDGDSFVSPQASQPTGTTRISNAAAKDTTDNAGQVSVNITDHSESPQPEEWSDTYAYTTGDHNAGAGDSVGTKWLRSLQVAEYEVTYDGTLIDGELTPGRPGDFEVVAYNADGSQLENFDVTLTVDHGFLSDYDSDGNLVPSPAAANGGLFGEWQNSGTSKTYSVRDASQDVAVAIERDPGFDDNGAVDVKLTAGSGTAADSETVTFRSGDDDWGVYPLNPGSLSVQLADDEYQTVDILDTGKAPTSESVFYDVVATDQFGNRVRVPVDLADDTADADFDNWGAWWSHSNFTNEEPGYEAYAWDDTVQTISADWENADVNKYGDTDTTTAGVQLGRVTSDTDLSDDSSPLTWYEINFAPGAPGVGSTYTLGQDGPELNDIGDTVTEEFTAIDQHGEPIEDITVKFFRTGPDTEQDGDGNITTPTGSDGVAEYVFQGAKAGTADITAVPYFWLDDDDDSSTPRVIGERIDGATRMDSVRFADLDAKTSIEALLGLRNQVDGDDVAKVNAPSAAQGATVKLFKVRADGSRKLVATKTANSLGNAKFVVADARPGKASTYQAKVLGTAATFADWTPKSSIK